MNQKNTLLAEMGNRITRMRKKMNLSQEQLAEKADVSPQLLSTAERGTKGLRPENLLKISKALEVSTDYLLTGEMIDKDYRILSEKLQSASPDSLRTIEEIVERCLTLCKEKPSETL